MTRPETGDNYGYGIPDGYDRDAWKNFTLWRPGDRSTGDERASTPASWWTETSARTDRGNESAHRFEGGDAVRSRHSIGGTLGGAVPAGTLGEVVSVRHGVLDERVTVRFENGYTEEVNPADLKYESGWY